jgi:exopolyphosphatase/guanosine-5'-triphosphate,3'-diphosphate pyrophosphatase
MVTTALKATKEIPQYTNNHYAVVDLGSNSFHLLIVQQQQSGIIVVDKIKTKVRLASGLDHQNKLSDSIMHEGLHCLKNFALYLASIPNKNIKIVATATLRLATNRDDFLNQANEILPLPIELLSGTQEAETIFKGVSHTCDSLKKRIVFDIGGASTEIIVGSGFEVKHCVSLNIGCVSFNNAFFNDDLLSSDNFNNAITAAKHQITPIAAQFKSFGWDIAMGSSGTMQAIMEILKYRERELVITMKCLRELKQEMLNFHSIIGIRFEGLREDRIPVLASGLSILIALFEVLSIQSLRLSKGALREGLLFSMLKLPQK